MRSAANAFGVHAAAPNSTASRRKRRQRGGGLKDTRLVAPNAATVNGTRSGSRPQTKAFAPNSLT